MKKQNQPLTDNKNNLSSTTSPPARTAKTSSHRSNFLLGIRTNSQKRDNVRFLKNGTVYAANSPGLRRTGMITNGKKGEYKTTHTPQKRKFASLISPSGRKYDLHTQIEGLPNTFYFPEKRRKTPVKQKSNKQTREESQSNLVNHENISTKREKTFTFTKASLEAAQRENKSIKSRNQQQTMSISSKYVRANDLAIAYNPENADGDWEWLHIGSHALLGHKKAQRQDNLFVGRKEVNTQMMFLEQSIPILVKRHGTVTLRTCLETFPNEKHIGIKLDYDLEWYDHAKKLQKRHFSFYPYQKQNTPHHALKYAVWQSLIPPSQQNHIQSVLPQADNITLPNFSPIKRGNRQSPQNMQPTLSSIKIRSQNSPNSMGL